MCARLGSGVGEAIVAVESVSMEMRGLVVGEEAIPFVRGREGGPREIVMSMRPR